MISLLLLLLLSCTHKTRQPLLPPAAPVIAVDAPSGRIVDGVYIDARFGFTLPLATGWAPTLGVADGALRLSATNADTGARVSVSAREPGSLSPVLRPDCEWTFEDRGRYRILRVSGEITVATCTPNEPTAARVFLVILARTDAAWHLEIEAPGTSMAAARYAGHALLAGARWTGADAP